MSNILTSGKKYKLSQSVDGISKIRNNKSNNIYVIQNNNINPNENYHYKYNTYYDLKECNNN